MKYPASPLTPFPPTFQRNLFTSFADVSPSSRPFLPPPNVYPSLFCRPFVFMVLRIAFPATPLVSQSSALPPGITLQRTPPSFQLCVLNAGACPDPVGVPQWQRKQGRPLPDLHNFGAPKNTFRINTSISVASKGLYLPSESTLVKKRGEGEGYPALHRFKSHAAPARKGSLR
jgi:hypothetical protein